MILLKDNIQDIGEEVYQKAPTSKEHLAYLVCGLWGIKLPYPSTCHDSQLDALWNLFINQNDFNIWYAMRGSGKTFLIAILSVLESIFKPRCGITVIGGSSEQSKQVIKYVTEFWKSPYIDYNLLRSDITKYGYELKNGSSILALASSETSVRGKHPQKLRLDEIDTMSEETFNSAMGQPKSNFGITENTLLSSTLHHSGGLMAKILDEYDTKYQADLYQWCYKDMILPYGFWTMEEVETKRKNTTVEMFEAEYELKRPLPGKAIFDYIQIESSFKRYKDLKINPNYKSNIVIGGIDWGYNCTVLNLTEYTGEYYNTFLTVEWQNTELNKKCHEILEICKKYNVNGVFVDSSPKDCGKTLNSIFNKDNFKCSVYPVSFNKWKGIGINIIRYMLQNNILNIKSKSLKNKLQKYHYKNPELEIIDKVDDHFCDSLIAWAVCYWRLLDSYIDNKNYNDIKPMQDK